MNVTEMIGTFLEFFGDRGHQVVPGSSLVPPGGDKVLFTTAGMHPLTRYLEGRPHPLGSRLTGVQRCLRTTDLDEVGDDRHLTVFQMQLGPDRSLTEADLRYLHQTHGLPPELVTELLNQPHPATGCLASRSGTLNRRAARVRLADAEE